MIDDSQELDCPPSFSLFFGGKERCKVHLDQIDKGLGEGMFRTT